LTQASARVRALNIPRDARGSVAGKRVTPENQIRGIAVMFPKHLKPTALGALQGYERSARGAGQPIAGQPLVPVNVVSLTGGCTLSTNGLVSFTITYS
jgi:hypothetical protein